MFAYLEYQVVSGEYEIQKTCGGPHGSAAAFLGRIAYDPVGEIYMKTIK
jgi:hypothetical protein